MAPDSPTEYDVALSFAGEDRPYVGRVAAALSGAGVRVFYDEYETVTLWGKDLYVHLTEVYSRASSYTVLFISEHYAKKLWPNLERRGAQARALSQRQEYILPARFDDTEIPGLLPTVGYVDLRTKSPEQLAAMLLKKIGRTVPSEPTSVVVDQKAVLALIVKVQSQGSSVAQCVAEALALARSVDDKALAEFCINELVGYPTETTEAELAARTYRYMPAYCTPGKIDIEAMGFRGVSLFTVVHQNRDRFFEKNFVISEPIGSVETKASRDSRGFWITTRKVRDFNPSADKGDVDVHCYSEPDVYGRIVAGVRAELTRRLTALVTRPVGRV